MNLQADNLIIRKRVLLGEDDDNSRRGEKVVIARSECRFHCKNEDVLSQCISAIKESDEHLRNRPKERMLWDWQSTWVELGGDGYGGGTVVLGVAWYDLGFFHKNKKAYLNATHLDQYLRIGIDNNDIRVEHWIRA